MLRRVQPRRDSWLEAGANVALGFVLALVIQAVVYPLFGIATTMATDGAVALIFTAVSLVRSYLVRRAFETFGCRMASSTPALKPAPARPEPSHARP